MKKGNSFFPEFPIRPVNPSSAAKGKAASSLENADFTRQNVATPEYPKEIKA